METLRYVVLVNGLLAVVSLAYYVLLRRETFFGANRLALWLGLTSAFVLPLLELPDWRPQPVRTVMQRTAQVIVPKVLPSAAIRQPGVTITFPNGQTFPAFQKPQIPAEWSWQDGLIGLYILGVLWLLIRLGRQLTSLGKLIRQSVHERYTDFILVRNEGITSPFSFFGWVVLNPDQHTPDELEQVLRHERVHVRQRHSVDMLGAELVCIVFWFNPAAYLFRHLLHQTLEFSADRVVLAEGVDATLYQYNLLKVSLSGGQSILTNHFSMSQLKSRIVMLNKPNSPKATWLKYPVIFIAALIVASAFAQPKHLKVLSDYVPKTTTEKIAAMDEPAKESIQPVMAISPTSENEILRPKSNSSLTNQLLAQSVDSRTDSIRDMPRKDLARVSPSRYMVYQGDYLYWIVTPRTTFDDFTVIRQELAKYGCKLQLNELKYDPLHAYIERLALTVVGSGGVQAKVNELANDDKPIPVNAGYLIHTMKNSRDYEVWASRLSGRFSKTFPLYQTAGEENFPDTLRKIAADDEAVITQFITGKNMEYLVLAGERKYGPLGIGFRKFDKYAIKKGSSRGDFVEVNSDGSLSVDKAKEFTKVFINNEPVSHEDIRSIKINQLYTLAVVLGYDNSTQKRTGTEYLIFYVNKDN